MKKMLLILLYTCCTWFYTIAQNITDAEYFIDTDPGPGNGISITVSSGTTISFSESISISSLSPGFHILAIRTKGADGKWGLFERRGFYVNAVPFNSPDITAAEYFIDTDPGVGNGIVIPVSSGATVAFNPSIPLGSLSPGSHLIAIRTRDANGKWGLFERRGFYVNPLPVNAPDMVRAEYFLDADPGVGGGMPITITQSSHINQNFVLNIPPGTLNGQHFLAMRFQGVDGKWGLFDFDTIAVSGILPVSLLSFNARKSGDGKKADLEWVTTTEQNVSHFEIQRSADGINYSIIGRVNAINVISGSHYNWQDIAPLSKINYYRLKMVDTDASFKISPVRTVRFADKDEILVFPTVTNSLVFVQSEKEIVTELININGQSLQQKILKGSISFDLSALPAGTYFIRAGAEKKSFKVVKQ